MAGVVDANARTKAPAAIGRNRRRQPPFSRSRILALPFPFRTMFAPSKAEVEVL
jgi:hypothetical protein